ncbi:hypothetical protein HYH02_002237 [Chlamydomonas schloesseri]|uniref:Uncharacterized protein n=1 Tax=Chlamydomonas schloesseri TaxID=2026947 RepID=A0A835WRP0_9CHLO|nr:hypothetical protein HYH02_002237 [Chlamydomonas schloesseri]|eukprot:KAG2452893.1 hypothetical protein HYH02_002237 [Chlamydomonas schloesseri]
MESESKADTESDTESDKHTESDSQSDSETETPETETETETETPGLTPVCREGDLDKVSRLLAAGADPSAKGLDGITPLHCAAAKGKTEVVKVLLAAGADVEAQVKDGSTPLHFAAYRGKAGVVVVLLSAGANGEAQNKSGSTALHMACVAESEAVIEALLAAGVTPDPRNLLGWAPRHLAPCNLGVYYRLRAAEKAAADKEAAEAPGLTPLHEACKEGDAGEVSRLLAAGADPSARALWDGFTPLHCAAVSGHPEVVSLLLNAGADVEARTKDGGTPIHYASCLGNTKALKVLLIAGANGEAPSNSGMTPLHCASMFANKMAVFALLRAGRVTPDPVNRLGWTPLDWAGHANVVPALESAVLKAAKNDVKPPEQHGHRILRMTSLRDTDWRCIIPTAASARPSRAAGAGARAGAGVRAGARARAGAVEAGASAGRHSSNGTATQPSTVSSKEAVTAAAAAAGVTTSVSASMQPALLTAAVNQPDAVPPLPQTCPASVKAALDTGGPESPDVGPVAAAAVEVPGCAAASAAVANAASSAPASGLSLLHGSSSELNGRRGGGGSSGAACPAVVGSGPAAAPDLDLLRAVKTEPGRGGGPAAGEVRYIALAARPFDAAELAVLKEKYMEDRIVEKDMSRQTRHGTIRPNTRVARVRPVAESAYPQLWPHLQQLRRQAEAVAAEAGAGGENGGDDESNTAPPSLAAASKLLFALRALQEHERVPGVEAAPRDAVLARVLPGYGVEVSAAAQAADGGAGQVVGVDVVDLTADEIDIEEYLLNIPVVAPEA